MDEFKYFNKNQEYVTQTIPFQKENGPYIIKDGGYIFDHDGQEHSVKFIFEKDGKEPVLEICKNAITSGALVEAYDYIAKQLAEKHAESFDLTAYQKEYYDPGYEEEGLSFSIAPETFAEKLELSLEPFDPKEYYNPYAYDQAVSPINLDKVQEMRFSAANKEHLQNNINEAHYEYDPLSSMKKISLPFQKDEALYTVKEGYCYFVNPANRKEGGEDQTFTYVAVVDKKNSIVADFIEYDDPYKAILQAKLAAAELILKDDDLRLKNNTIAGNFDFREFLNDVYKDHFINEEGRYTFGEKDNQDEYRELIEKTLNYRNEIRQDRFKGYLDGTTSYLGNMVDKLKTEESKKEIQKFIDAIKKVKNSLERNTKICYTINKQIHREFVKEVSFIVNETISNAKQHIKNGAERVIKDLFKASTEKINKIMITIRKAADQSQSSPQDFKFNYSQVHVEKIQIQHGAEFQKFTSFEAADQFLQKQAQKSLNPGPDTEYKFSIKWKDGYAKQGKFQLTLLDQYKKAPLEEVLSRRNEITFQYEGSKLSAEQNNFNKRIEDITRPDIKKDSLVYAYKSDFKNSVKNGESIREVDIKLTEYMLENKKTTSLGWKEVLRKHSPQAVLEKKYADSVIETAQANILTRSQKQGMKR